MPKDIGFVVHDGTPRMKACAVDLLVTQLCQHEPGVPDVPRQIMIPPQWSDGPGGSWGKMSA